MVDELFSIDVDPSDVIVRGESKREIEFRLFPWDTMINTLQGAEEFERGATIGTPDDGVYLMGMNHEARIGLGQDGKPSLTRPVVGRSNRVWEEDDGPRASFRIGRTQAGDDMLALAEDGIVTGVSVEFATVPGGTKTVRKNGRKVNRHHHIQLRGASMTHRPAYGAGSAVIAIREEIPEMAEDTQPVESTPVDFAPVLAAIEANRSESALALRAFEEKMEERYRSEITIPGSPVSRNLPQRGTWVHGVLNMLTGNALPAEQMRALEDLVTSDNIGVVPDAVLNEIVGVIDATRPFLSTTRRLTLPPAGMTLQVPVIRTRATAGVVTDASGNAGEKVDIPSGKTEIDTDSFDAVTIAGGGDISVQLLRRSSPSYLGLFLELLAEAVSGVAETEALTALLQSGVNAGGGIDPDDLSIGSAWAAGAAVKKPPTTIWLSSEAVGAFIDAKANGTNAPLYSNLAANFVAGGGPGGTISGLRPVHVPALDAFDTDVIVGPSSGFGWTEDGTFTLQVDVPSKAGRDVALVTIMWFAPLYPDAFTAYSLGS